jgi:hypothetical protein
LNKQRAMPLQLISSPQRQEKFPRREIRRNQKQSPDNSALGK